MQKHVLYDYDQDKLITTTVYESYEAAVDAIDPRLNNVIAVPLAGRQRKPPKFKLGDAVRHADTEKHPHNLCEVIRVYQNGKIKVTGPGPGGVGRETVTAPAAEFVPY